MNVGSGGDASGCDDVPHHLSLYGETVSSDEFQELGILSPGFAGSNHGAHLTINSTGVQNFNDLGYRMINFHSDIHGSCTDHENCDTSICSLLSTVLDPVGLFISTVFDLAGSMLIVFDLAARPSMLIVPVFVGICKTPISVVRLVSAFSSSAIG